MFIHQSFKINLPKILMIHLTIFLSLGLTGNGLAARTEIIRGHLVVNGEAFTIKGVGYSPVPIGADPAPPTVIISLQITAPYMSVTFPY